MLKFLNAPALLALVCLVSPAALPKLVTSQDHVPVEPTATPTVDPPREHVRRLRARKQVEVGAVTHEEETARTSPGPNSVLHSKDMVDRTPTGSTKPIKHKKRRPLAQQKTRKTQGEQETTDEASPPAQTDSDKPRGLFDAFFNAN